MQRILIILTILITVSACSTDNQPISDTITLPVTTRGDLVYVPIEEECQSKMENYMESEETICELISSEIGTTEEDCPNGFSSAGCSICTIKCEN